MAVSQAPAPSRGGSIEPPLLIPHFIDGQTEPGVAERWGVVHDPSSGSVRARVPFGADADLERAVASGRRAFSDWSAWSPLRRARVLFRFRELLVELRGELVRNARVTVAAATDLGALLRSVVAEVG